MIWFDPGAAPSDWNASDCTLGCIIRTAPSDMKCLGILFNAQDCDVDFRLPAEFSRRRWALAIDTAAASPRDIYASRRAGPAIDPQRVHVTAKSLVVLVGSRLRA